jgi:hypothetical protein
LSILESRYADLLYLHDDDLFQLVYKGSYAAPDGAVTVNVTRRNFNKARMARQGDA